jgi:hypothetical protein
MAVKLPMTGQIITEITKPPFGDKNLSPKGGFLYVSDNRLYCIIFELQFLGF